MENHLVLAHRAEILDAQFPRHVVQLGHGHRLQLGDVQRSGDVVLIAVCFVAFVRFVPPRRTFAVGSHLGFGAFHCCGLGRNSFRRDDRAEAAAGRAVAVESSWGKP